MRTLPLKPNQKGILAYHTSLAEFQTLRVKHESAVRAAFQALLEECTALVNRGREDKWKLVPEFSLKTKAGARITPDGVLLDTFRLVHGVWEAKDTADDLDVEIRSKFKLGYPRTNILFQSPGRAVLVQDGNKMLDRDISKPINLVEILKAFFEYQPPEFDQWEKAVAEFKERLPQIGGTLTEIIRREETKNAKFTEAFEQFVILCRQSLNPNLRKEAVEEMLVQHLLTERIFRRIFGTPDFMHRNNIAQEIEKVVAALTSRSFSRDSFLKELNRFYKAIEDAADTIPEFAEKQKFLNTVYEQFFQGFAVDRADTLGIVYTPQEIVDFMLASVEEILRKEFGRELGDKDVQIIDPFVGTGNFMVNLMRRLPKTQLEYKYREELHCNEVMLLPYYIATMNIEHTFLEQTAAYQSFPGVCLVDTFETAEKQTEFGFFNPENTERVKRQKAATIFVVIGNPPYNANQVNENDNNKNRKYQFVDGRVKQTYVKDSTATLRNKLSGDPYVKAYRWASDKLKGEGVVAYVSNASFISKRQFDGMRKHLAQDFDALYILNLQGEVREGEQFAGTTHNVFGIKLGISINLLVRGGATKSRPARIWYHSVPEDWRRQKKLAFLASKNNYRGIAWSEVHPDKHNTWLTEGLHEDFGTFPPLGVKKLAGKLTGPRAPLFLKYALGISTNRDDVVYGFDADRLSDQVLTFIRDYNAEVDRYHAKKRRISVDDFVDTSRVKWSRDLKQELENGVQFEPRANAIRRVEYRPFCPVNVWLQDAIVDRIGPLWTFIPPPDAAHDENRLLCLTGPGSQKEFMTLMTSRLVDLHFVGAASATQCFPFYRYDGDDGQRRENIPLSTLLRFQKYYSDEEINKWQIFHYIYALLYHPEYRARYTADLRRDLPRIPFIGKDAKTFHAFADIGRKLADLHVDYEGAAEYKLRRIENRDTPLNWRVEKMRLTKDKRAIVYNEFLTLDGVPPETFVYRLGNRPAIEWVIDQY